MEPEYDTATQLKIKRENDVDFFIPMYQTTIYGEQWMQGVMYTKKEDAISAHKYEPELTRLKIFKVTLPIKNIGDDVSL